MISGGGTRSDWVKNLLAGPEIEIEIGPDSWRATAMISDHAPDHPARAALAGRYQGWQPGQPLTTWAIEGLVIEITVHDGATGG